MTMHEIVKARSGGRCISEDYRGDDLGRYQRRSDLPRVPAVGHMHNCHNASTEMLRSSMRCTRRYLAV